ncbi:putative 7-deoxyloganetin glucosyltransferase [Helianthus anomalus]
MLNYLMIESEAIPRGLAVILNTFDALELDSVKPLLAMNPNIFTIGPLQMMQQYVHDDRLKHIGSNLWKEDVSCINWLDTKKPGSVVYVNFGSITVMTKEQLIEFGWGLANSKKDFLWITRPDIVGGDEAMMPPEFVDETKGRGMVTSWCPQEEVITLCNLSGVCLKKKTIYADSYVCAAYTLPSVYVKKTNNFLIVNCIDLVHLLFYRCLQM